jgi:hypothetical protein
MQAMLFGVRSDADVRLRFAKRPFWILRIITIKKAIGHGPNRSFPKAALMM